LPGIQVQGENKWLTLIRNAGLPKAQISRKPTLQIMKRVDYLKRLQIMADLSGNMWVCKVCEKKFMDEADKSRVYEAIKNHLKTTKNSYQTLAWEIIKVKFRELSV